MRKQLETYFRKRNVCILFETCRADTVICQQCKNMFYLFSGMRFIDQIMTKMPKNKEKFAKENTI